MSQEEYYVGWAYYLVGAALLWLCFWFLTRKISLLWIKTPLRVLVTVLLFMPWYSYENQSYLSPAWTVAILELLFDGLEAFWRAGIPLIIASILAITLPIGFEVYRARR